MATRDDTYINFNNFYGDKYRVRLRHDNNGEKKEFSLPKERNIFIVSHVINTEINM